MHLPVRLRVPLVGLAIAPPRCSSARVAAAPAPPTHEVPTTAVAVVGAETVAKAKLDALMTQVCVQYKAAKKACPKPGSAERKQLQQSFVAQLVQQAEFDEAGKQLKVTVKQADMDSNLKKLELQYAKGADGKVDAAKWKKVLADNHTTRGHGRREPAQQPAAPGDLREADEERDRLRQGSRGLLRQEQEDATRRPRAARSATSWSRTRRWPTRSTRSSPRATRSSRRWPRSTRSIRARRPSGGKLGTHPEGPDRPGVRQGRLQPSRPARSRRRSRAPTAGT